MKKLSFIPVLGAMLLVKMALPLMYSSTVLLAIAKKMRGSHDRCHRKDT